jgi:hypothetical protein
MIINNCDFCKKENLTKAYRAKSTLRDLNVFVCRDCGLIQSWPRLSGVYNRVTSISGEADWGYIRYGKQLRLDASMKIMNEYIDFNKINSALDIGANRGFFLNNLGKNYEHMSLMAVEPDKFIVKESLYDSKIQLFNGKVEDFDSMGKKYDFIHSSHTFEHMTSASKGFDIAYNLLNDGGYLYLEIPRTEMIENEDFITEYFIDNHVFHFTSETLKNYISKYNYDILYEEKNDFENHVFILKKTEKSNNNLKILNNFESNHHLVTNYSRQRKINLKNLNKAGLLINDLIDKKDKIAIWGMGRIFDIFYHYGDINWDGVKFFVDKYLPDYTSEVNGIKIERPEVALTGVSIDTLIIFSDAFTKDIEDDARKILKNVTEIINYNDLMSKNGLE